jgi:hypothetical protein
MAINTTYRGRFDGMFDANVSDVVEQALEMLDYGDEIFFAEIGFECDSRVSSVTITIGPGSALDPIDLCDDDDDDDIQAPIGSRYWSAVDELEMVN